jgi:hypothetical protein
MSTQAGFKLTIIAGQSQASLKFLGTVDLDGYGYRCNSFEALNLQSSAGDGSAALAVVNKLRDTLKYAYINRVPSRRDFNLTISRSCANLVDEYIRNNRQPHKICNYVLVIEKTGDIGDGDEMPSEKYIVGIQQFNDPGPSLIEQKNLLA